MKTPQFWHKKKFISYLLLPLSGLYLLGYFLDYFRKKTHKINKPIICIGNLVAGGAGKTPAAIALGKILKELNINFAYLSSGYGSKIKDFTLVKPEVHNSEDVGDEPLMLAEISETFICKDRVLGATQITKIPEKKLIVMDDGFQNPNLKKDFSILIIDGNYGFGNGFIIPSGALREPVYFGMKRADLVVIIDEDKFKITSRFCQNKKVIKAKTITINYERFAGKNVIAFCGIGRPEKFFESLENNKINLLKKFSYADHHQYENDEIEKMLEIAKQNNTTLITTKKDWVRLSPAHKNQIDFVDIKIEFEETNFLKEKILQLTS